MKPWAQELLWVRRNDQGVIVGMEENLPKQGDFVPTAPSVSRKTAIAAYAAVMNKHDQRRKDALVNTLLRSKERAEEAQLYLTANDRDPEQVMNVGLVLEHIEIALGHLGVGNDE